MPTTDSYATDQLRRVLGAGPYPGEDFFRLKVTGNGASNWVNVTPEQLAGLVELLDA
jgi:hypothetical protein